MDEKINEQWLHASETKRPSKQGHMLVHGGSSSHCIDLHNQAWILFGQKQASMEFCSINHDWKAANSQTGW